jgi:hypothetical protein
LKLHQGQGLAVQLGQSRLARCQWATMAGRVGIAAGIGVVIIRLGITAETKVMR